MGCRNAWRSVLCLVDQPLSAIHGIIAAQLGAHLFDQGAPPSARRRALKLGWPARFSSIHSRAKRPDWISSRMRRISARTRHRRSAAAHACIAVFGGVRDRVVHVGDAALVDQIDDQLDLVHDTRNRPFPARSRPRPGFRSPALISSTSARRTAPSARRTGRFRTSSRKAGLDDTGAPAANGRAIGEADLLCVAGYVAGRPPAGTARRRRAGIRLRTVWPGPLGAIMNTSRSGARLDELAKWMLKPWAKASAAPWLCRLSRR